MLAIHGDLASFPSDDTPQAHKAYSNATAQPTGPKCRTLQAKGQWTMGGVRFSNGWNTLLRFKASSIIRSRALHMYFLLPGEENLMSSKHFRAATLFLTSLLVLFFAAFSARAQVQRPSLTVEWIFGKEGSSVAEVPEFKWLADNSAIFYDSRRPEAQRTFERLDPITRERHPALDMAQSGRFPHVPGPFLGNQASASVAGLV